MESKQRDKDHTHYNWDAKERDDDSPFHAERTDLCVLALALKPHDASPAE